MIGFKTISKDFIWSIIIKIVYALFGPVTTMILAGYMLSDKFGNYSLFLTDIALLSMPIVTIFPITIPRGFNDDKVLNNSFNLLIIFTLLSIIYLFLRDYDIINISIIILLILSFGLERIYSNYLLGLNKVILSQIGYLVIKPILFFLLISVFMISDILLSLNRLIILQLVSYLIPVIYFLKPIRKLLSIFSINWKEIYIRKDVLLLFFIGAIQTLFQEIDYFFLNKFGSFSEIAYYRIAQQFSILVTFLLSPLIVLLTPSFVRFKQKRDYGSIAALLKKYIFLVFILTLPYIFFQIVFGKTVLVNLFGAEYNNSFLPMLVLTIGKFFNLIFGISLLFLKIMGYESYIFKRLILLFIIYAILDFILVPYFGLLGAAVSNSITFVLWNSLFFVKMIYVLKKELI